MGTAYSFFRTLYYSRVMMAGERRSPKEYYGTISRETVDQIKGTWAESVYYASRCPYYKVTPDMALALINMDVDIHPSKLRLPYLGFEIRLPVGLIREEPGAPYVRAILVSYIETIEADDPSRQASVSLYISVDFDWPGSVAVNEMGMIFPLERRTTFQEVLDSIDTTMLNKMRNDYKPKSSKVYADCVRLAIGVIFLALGGHKSIADDRPGTVERLREEKLNKAAGRNIEPKRRHIVDIKLPRDVQRALHEVNEGNGKPRKFGHLRAGHLRWQRHGEGLSQTKCIFIAPTIVRPDLPMQPEGRSYVVGDENTD